MNTTDTQTPRDPAKPADYYEAVVAQAREAIGDYTSYNNPALFFAVVPHFLRIASARYSAGEEVEHCREALRDAAQHQLRFIVEGKQYKFGGKGGIDNYLELYGAAYLVGLSGELIEALKKCTYTEKTEPWLTRLIDQLCDVLTGQCVETDEAQMAELKNVDADIALLPGLFSAVSHNNKSMAGAALEEYLAKHWGPALEKNAKKELKSPRPTYCGKWCYFAAAMCKQLGAVPELSAKARTYLPIELVDA